MSLKTNPLWEEKILELKATHPRMGDIRLHAMLEQGFGNGEPPSGVGDPPATATVRRILKRKWDGMAEGERVKYQQLHWPEAFIREYLPWEASPIALELLRYLTVPTRQKVLDEGICRRPTIRLSQWAWRVAKFAPEAPFHWRLEMASHLAAAEGIGDVESMQDISRTAEAQVVTGIYIGSQK